MDKITNEILPIGTSAQEDNGLEKPLKSRLKKGFLNYAGVFVGIFLMFAVIVIVTTDITLTSFSELAALGLDFFLLLFCSYSMYISCTDSGMRAGLASKLYNDLLNAYEEYKKKILECGYQARLPEFCRYYIEEELKNSRLEILAVVGLSYESYIEDYLKLDDSDIDNRTDLSSAQKEAIKKASGIKPIKLTPEMIMKRGRGSSRRSPLGMRPETKKYIQFGSKFITTFLVALIMSMIMLDIVVEPTWVIFASCMLKLLAVVMNGFAGYRFGYENIVKDTVNYINDQIDLMKQSLLYFNSFTEK